MVVPISRCNTDWRDMMTSSNENIFCVTGPLCREFTGPGEFPTQRPVTQSFDVFFDLYPNKRLSKQPWGWWFEMPSWSLWCQRNVHKFSLAVWWFCIMFVDQGVSPREPYTLAWGPSNNRTKIFCLEQPNKWNIKFSSTTFLFCISILSCFFDLSPVESHQEACVLIINFDNHLQSTTCFDNLPEWPNVECIWKH